MAICLSRSYCLLKTMKYIPFSLEEQKIYFMKIYITKILITKKGVSSFEIL